MKLTNPSYRLLALTLLLAVLVACRPATVAPATSPAATVGAPTSAPTETPQPAAPTAAPEIPPTDLAGVLAALPALLAEQPDLDGLLAHLQSWAALEVESEPLCEADLDGDGEAEALLLLAAPPSEGGGLMGPVGRALAVLQRSGAGHALVGSRVFDPGLRLDVALHDLTGDGRPEVVATFEECGAHTCTLFVHVLRLHSGALQSLLPEPVSMPYAELTIEDRDGDGRAEIAMHGGQYGSVGAGPMQTRTEVYAWNGQAVSLIETVYDPSSLRLHALQEGDRALRRGDLPAALSAYRRVATDPELEQAGFWDDAEERRTLEAWAWYRLVTVQAALGDVAAAQESLATLHRAYAGHPVVPLAEAFWAAYEPQADLSAGCAAATAYAAANPQVVESFGYYGYGNPGYTVEDLCYLEA